MSDREDMIEEAARVIWETSRADEGTISATGANIVARALANAGALASGEVEWGVEIEAEAGLNRVVVRSHPNTETEATRWATLHALGGSPAIVVRRRLAGPWVQVEAIE